MSVASQPVFWVALVVCGSLLLLTGHVARCVDAPAPAASAPPAPVGFVSSRLVLETPKVYIVAELKTYNCTPPYVYYDSTSDLFWQHLRNHPWRTYDPEEADIFWIPFDTRGSYYIGRCANEWHHDRLNRVLDWLRNYTYFKRHRGRDFFWDILYWQVLHADNDFHSFIEDHHRQTTLRHIIHGSFLRFHRHRPLLYEGEKFLFMPKDHLHVRADEWERELYDPIGFRTVLVPIVPRSILLATPHGEKGTLYGRESTFEQWLGRKGLFYFRGGGRSCVNDTDAERQFLYKSTPRIMRFFNTSTILPPKRAIDPSLYEVELYSHKFCLILRCDGPAGSRFFDAIASDCIPVILSDSFKLAAAPFVELINYDRFTITLGTLFFQRDPVAALDWAARRPLYTYREMFAALQEAKEALIWTHPRTRVHEYSLMEAFAAVKANLALERSSFRTAHENIIDGVER